MVAIRPARERKGRKNPWLCAFGCMLMFFHQVWFRYHLPHVTCSESIGQVCGRCLRHLTIHSCITKYAAAAAAAAALSVSVPIIFGHPIAIWKTPSPK